MTDQQVAVQAREMTDRQLLDAWNQVEGFESMTPLQQAVIDEIERRNLDI